VPSPILATGAVILVAVIVFDLALGRADVHVPSIVRDLLQVAALFLVLLVLLRRSGVDLVSLVTTSAVLTAVIGFALQSTIANVFAGVALQVDNSGRIGEWVKIGEREGAPAARPRRLDDHRPEQRAGERPGDEPLQPAREAPAKHRDRAALPPPAARGAARPDRRRARNAGRSCGPETRLPDLGVRRQ